MLQAGDIVQGACYPEVVEILRVDQLDAEYYSISAVGRKSKVYYERLLDRTEIQYLEKMADGSVHQEVSVEEIQQRLHYYLIQLDQRYQKGRILGNKNLMPLPHQIEAVYGRMLQVPRVRFLLADDPGAGKTIMAGMLIKELRARESAWRILILVPPLVLRQWQEELSEKFNEHFVIINRNLLRQYGGQNPFLEHDFCLASLFWAARDEVKALIQEADFDLVIVDEAHKMAAYTHGLYRRKTSKTKLYQLGESLLRKSPQCLLLTATPHKGDVENFRHLMCLIDPDIFSSPSVNASLREKSNPFIIRRLKESLTNFDGTPLFPKRITKTIQYELTEPELMLYEAVTEYVRNHFNRAINQGRHSAAFAMMLLQRRLPSSTEAIHLSLTRRKKRLKELLEATEQERARLIKKLEKLEIEDYDEESYEEQERIERALEQAIDDIDPDELKIEIQVLEQLLQQTELLRRNMVERKYDELERTLFGSGGLLERGEKIIIFTESADTLFYLERRLKQRVPVIAKIIGKYSMDERRRQVELFRDECQIMLATDAGGESINLQFCNQMINYDIPWNPNRLEQRMGRIHRIGQKSEVAIFNLVAANTREGDVMIRLLNKMEQMRKDLGSDLVYDFIGEILDDESGSLADLMQAAILNRENLDDIITKMDKRISEEHQRLLQFFEKERVAEPAFDLPTLRREQHDGFIQALPKRVYAAFVKQVLSRHHVRVYASNDDKVFRIDRFPKYIRDQCRQYSLDVKLFNEPIRFTGHSAYATKDVTYLNGDHDLVKLSMRLAAERIGRDTPQCYVLPSSFPEKLLVNMYACLVADGTGEELLREIVFLGQRGDGSVIRLDPYWIFQKFPSDDISSQRIRQNSELQREALKAMIRIRDKVKKKRETQLNKIADYLVQTFSRIIHDLIEKRVQYEQDNENHKNSALINQVNANILDAEIRRDERLTLIERQRSIGMEPPKLLMQFEFVPAVANGRIIPADYAAWIEEYEKRHGRGNFKSFHAFALVDFYSERYTGEPRYIIVSTDCEYIPDENHLEDLRHIFDYVYIYTVANKTVVEERKLESLVP